MLITSNEKKWCFVVMKLHLASDPATVEVCVPPAVGDRRCRRSVLVGWSGERDAEVTLLGAAASCCS